MYTDAISMTVVFLDYLPLCIYTAGVLVFFVVFEAVVGIRFGVPPDERRDLLYTLGHGLRRRAPLWEVLLRPLIRVGRKTRLRLLDAADEFERTPETDLAWLLHRHHLLDVRTSRAISRLVETGPDQVIDLLSADDRGRLPDLRAIMAPYLIYILVFASLLSFLSVVVLPRLQRILEEMAVECNAAMRVILESERWLPGGIVTIFWVGLIATLLGFVASKMIGFRLRRGFDRYTLGRFLLLGVLAGRSEQELASGVAALRPRLRDRVTEVAAVGDLPTLFRACGWEARDAKGLRDALDRHRRRRRMRHAVLVVVIRLVAPALVGGLVLLFAMATYGAIMHIAEVAGTLS